MSREMKERSFFHGRIKRKIPCFIRMDNSVICLWTGGTFLCVYEKSEKYNLRTKKVVERNNIMLIIVNGCLFGQADFVC